MNKIPKRNKRQFQKSTLVKCINCGEKFDLVSAIYIPICNDCRKTHKKGLIGAGEKKE